MIIQNVALGNRGYDIFIGNQIINSITDILHTLNPNQKSVVIITETNVADLYLKMLNDVLIEKGYEIHSLVLPSGESTKSLLFFEQVMRFCLQHNVERNHALIAFGGGVIGDLTGFVASTLRRGCRFIQIPTTLLSQVDSSVGGKTAINSLEGKNLIGTFYQPSAVIIDIQFLKSLSNRVYRSGYAEVIKYGLLGDKQFFDYLRHHNDLFLVRDTHFLMNIIAHCVKMKADIVSRDETEQGERALLNLGHTFGHAYEAETGYSDILHHGEAVAIGMVDAAEFSYRLNYLSLSDVSMVKKFLVEVGFNITIKDYASHISAEIILKHMMQDKKVSNNQMTLILLNNIGHAFINKNTDIQVLSDYLFNKIL
jgi:3-dehydroquinate synthase